MNQNNICCFIGRLVRDPETRRTQNGKEVASFTLAVDDGYGENKTCDFHDFVAWEGLANYVGKMGKGNKAHVIAKAKKRQYTDKEGNKRSVTEFVCDAIQNLTPKASGESEGEYKPQNASKKTPVQTSPAAQPFEETEEDDAELPF